MKSGASMRFATAVAVLVLLASSAVAWASGEGPATDRSATGMNMVLIHGLGSSAKVWNEVVPFLHHGFSVWTYEIPGHGRTEPLRNMSLDSVTQDLAHWLQDRGVTEPIVVGHGFGGMIAMNYAFRYADDVRKLVIIDATPKQLADAEQKADIIRHLADDYDAFVAGHFLSISSDEAIVHRVLDQALRTEQISFTQLMISSFDFDVTEDLYYQTTPIMVVGSSSMLPEPDLALEYLDAMGYANAQTISYKVMPENGHFVMLEDPIATAGVIIGWSLLQ